MRYNFVRDLGDIRFRTYRGGNKICILVRKNGVDQRRWFSIKQWEALTTSEAIQITKQLIA